MRVDNERAPLNLSFGCVGLSTFKTYTEAERVLDSAYGSGIRHFDVARVYGSGYCERILGRFLKSRGVEPSIATKFGLGMSNALQLPLSFALFLNWARKHNRTSHDPLHGSREPSPTIYERFISAEQVRREFDASRRALHVDKIDVYLFHEGIPRLLRDDALELLLRLKSTGEIGALGLAASGGHYLSLQEKDLGHFEVLQYERGRDGVLHKELLARHPTKKHIIHTLFKNTVQNVMHSELIGQLAKDHPECRFLFSSKNPAHIQANVSAALRDK